MNKQCIDAGKVFADSLPKGSRVLDCGSLDVNGAFRDSFSEHEYMGSDISPGRNVDVVQPDPFTLPFPDSHFDGLPIRIIVDRFENLYYPHEQGTLFIGEKI